jgi:hypothetical protein
MYAAIEVIREHYRAEHPRVFFRRTPFAENCELWNRTVDDWLDYSAARGDAPNWGMVHEYLTGYLGAVTSIMPDEVRAELQRLYDEARGANPRIQEDPFGFIEEDARVAPAPAAPRFRPVRRQRG